MSGMSKPKMDQTEPYTYEDYLTWDESERWELIDGVSPEERVINVYLHDSAALRWTAEYNPSDKLSPTMFADLMIDLSAVFRVTGI